MPKKTYRQLERENRVLRAEVARLEKLSDTQDRLLQRLTLKAGPIVLNRLDRTVMVGSTNLPLPVRCFQLLETLMLKRGEVITKEELTQALWGEDTKLEESNLPITVHRLRKLLGAAGELIQNVRGEGYIIYENGDAIL